MKHNKITQNSNAPKNIIPFSYERKEHKLQFQEIKNPWLFKLDLQFFNEDDEISDDEKTLKEKKVKQRRFLSTVDQKKLLEAVEKKRDRALELANELYENNERLNVEIEKIKDELNQAQENARLAAEAGQNFLQNNGELTKKITFLENQLKNNSEERYNELLTDWEKTQEYNDELQSQNKKLQEEFAELKERKTIIANNSYSLEYKIGYKPMGTEWDKLNNQLDEEKDKNTELQTKINDLEQENENTKKGIEKLKEDHNGDFKNWGKESKQQNSKITKLEEKNNKLKEEYNELKTKLNDSERLSRHLQGTNEGLLAENEEKELMINGLEKQNDILINGNGILNNKLNESQRKLSEHTSQPHLEYETSDGEGTTTQKITVEGYKQLAEENRILKEINQRLENNSSPSSRVVSRRGTLYNNSNNSSSLNIKGNLFDSLDNKQVEFQKELEKKLLEEEKKNSNGKLFNKIVGSI
ncbi:hypothetical protein [endosymbiont GvMRE of Glomus versiforme]|uniref:hypothetical protein n=1 Tax=endosymbiont GvMRE of Glomus versiforme TaxID=2039283 RepID=UPI000EBF4E53|nr:hypothetical protein [endosymbiont GvMRE of Glomus versiforme]RHZ36905.1 hypothetical protein GvMRE_I2g24 [endosymbiont GvMRE of Glomus versiforme]